MSRKKEEPTRRVHIHMAVVDIERLDLIFGTNSERPVGRSKAICKIIRHYLNQIEEEAAKSSKSLNVINDLSL